MRRPYRIVKEEGILLNILTPQGVRMLIFKPDEEYNIEVDGSDLWVQDDDGNWHYTSDHAGQMEALGWIEPIEEDEQ